MTTDLEKLENLTERLNQPKGEWHWDIQKNHLSWSTSIFRIFGISPADFKGTYEAFLETVHIDDRGSVQIAVDAALKGSVYSIDHKICLPNGKVRKVHEEAEVFFNHNGKALWMAGTVQDITELGQNSDEEYRALLLKMVENGGIELKDMREQVQDNTVAIAQLKTAFDIKLGIFTAVAALVSIATIIGILWLKGNF